MQRRSGAVAQPTDCWSLPAAARQEGSKSRRDAASHLDVAATARPGGRSRVTDYAAALDLRLGRASLPAGKATPRLIVALVPASSQLGYIDAGEADFIPPPRVSEIEP